MAFPDRGDGTSFVATGLNLVRGAQAPGLFARRKRAQNQPRTTRSSLPPFRGIEIEFRPRCGPLSKLPRSCNARYVANPGGGISCARIRKHGQS